MKLEKAIEIGDLNLKVADKKMPPDVKDALSLLIEAAKAIRLYREDMNPQWFQPLPGETPE